MPWPKMKQESAVMSAFTTQTIQMWQTVIEELRDTDQRDKGNDAPQSVQLSVFQDVMGSMPPMHRKGWNALISDKQVISTTVVPAMRA
jgi:hypothetical protein